MDNLQNFRRTDYCGTFSAANVGQEISVCGWVQRQRNLGGLIFVDLRDRTGLLQLSFDDSTPRDIFEKAASLRGEYVIAAKGLVREREYVAEMFCDRIAACRVYQKEKYTDASPYDYFQHSKGHLCRSEHGHGFIHPETSELLTRWLLLLKEQGEDAAFLQIRQELKELRRA